MKTRHVIILIIALAATVPIFAAETSQNKPPPSTIPVRPPSKERSKKSETEPAREQGIGSRILLKTDNTTVAVHVAPTRFVKNCEVAFERRSDRGDWLKRER